MLVRFHLPAHPVVRRRFRVLYALAAAGFGSFALYVALTVTTLDIDLRAYWFAAGRVLSGVPLYPPALLAGPINAQTLDAYIYPPPLALALAPFRELLGPGLPHLTWIALNIVALALAAGLAWRAGGGRFNLDSLLVLIPLVLLFGPLYSALVIGNVSLLIMLAMAIALAAGPRPRTGVAIALAVMFKVVPLTIVPALATLSRRALAAFGGTLVGLGLAGAILLPDAWPNFVRIFVNLAAGQTVYIQNLAPASVARSFIPALEPLARVASLGVALSLIGLSILLARTPGRWPAALAASVGAFLLLPATLWYHYLAVVLPFALAAWPRASNRGRIGLLVGYLAIGLIVPPMPLIGAALILAIAIRPNPASGGEQAVGLSEAS
jgi:hypothetical protein